MASITGSHKQQTLPRRKWYKDKIDNIAKILLADSPFFI